MQPKRVLTPAELDELAEHIPYATEAEIDRIRVLLEESVSPEVCPHLPTARQSAFLALDHLEAMYGGAAGGGKSDALLMAAAEFVHVPGYRALLLRRTLADLKLPGALLDRAKTWWAGIAHWNDLEKTFHFPSGATITFGYLEHENDKYRYAGAEFQFIGFDELTQFTATQYTFLFSRLRRTVDLADVPIRMRSATNPGGLGHTWVKQRFVTPAAVAALLSGHYRDVYERDGRAFVPSRLDDNPHLDRPEYERSLDNLDPVTRAELKRGDWSAAEDGRITPAWLRYYEASVTADGPKMYRGACYRLLNSTGQQIGTVNAAECRRITMVDSAGTSAEKAKEAKGKPRSFSVIGTFDVTPAGHLMIVSIWRERVEVPDLMAAIRNEVIRWDPVQIGIERANMGIGVFQTAARDPLLAGRLIPLEPEGKDKLTRAVPLLNMMERGEVWIHKTALWRENLESELLAWTGHPDEMADQIDVLAYAGMQVQQSNMGRVIVLESMR